MSFYLLTFRPQPSEYDLMETFLTVVKPQLIDSKTIINYVIVVEAENTINRHTHILVEFKKTKSKDNQLNAFLGNKPFKPFKQMLKNKLTNPNHAYDSRKLKDTREDYLHVLGYVFKEIGGTRRFYTIPEEDIVEGIEYYYQHRKIDKSQPEENNLKIMTSKNLHVNVYDFCKKNEMRPREEQLVMLKMKKAGYMFSQVNVKDTFQELDIHMFKDEYSDIEHPEPEDFTTILEQLRNCQQIIKENNRTFSRIEQECKTATGISPEKREIYKLSQNRFHGYFDSSSDEE